MGPRAWVPVGAMDREAVWTPLHLAVADWKTHWFSSPDLKLSQWQIMSGAAPAEIGGVSWRIFGRGLAIACSARGGCRIVQLALDARPDELPETPLDQRISDALGQRLLDDLAHRVEEALDPLQAQDLGETRISDPFGGLGGALLTLDEGSNPLLTIAIPVQRVMARCRTGKPRPGDHEVESRRRALGPSRVSLEASLGSVALDLAEFRRLAIGDVLVLDRKVGDPIDLHAPGSPVKIVHGALSESEGHKALILLPNSSGEDS